MLAAASCRACLLAARRPSSLLLAAAFPTSPRRHRSRRRFYATATATDSSSDAGSSSSSFALEVTDPLVLYENLVRSGRIQRDEAQVRLLYQLRRLHSDLVNYQPSMSLRYLLESSVPNNVTKRDGERDALPSRMLPDFNASRSLVRALTHEDDLSNLDSPVGFLLTGSVGTGKTMLLDLFYRSLPVKKQRKHYHSFLLGLYRKVFDALEQQRLASDEEEREMQRLSARSPEKGYPWSRREENKARALTKGWREVFAGGRKSNDPSLVKEYVLAQIALDLIETSTVLAFDEIQLVDIAGAGILRRVLTWYWRLGGVVIGTSNRMPGELYSQGLQADQFRAFLQHLQERSPVYELRSDNDWRRRDRSSNLDLFLGESSGSAMPAWSQRFDGANTWYTDLHQLEPLYMDALDGQKTSPKDLIVYGRVLAVPQQIEGTIARFSFAELCEKALGPADYLTLTSKYPTIVVTSIPQIKLSSKNEARRFITFLDAAYESKTRLICHAAAEPDDIFFPDAADVLSGDADNPLAQEMMGEVLQDLQAPYRPNISSYTSTRIRDSLASAGSEELPQQHIEEEGAESARDDSKQRQTPFAKMREAGVRPTLGQMMDQAAFKSLAIFTGQDEQFAYKRALSRIYELTSAEFLKTASHTPLPASERVWEQDVPSSPSSGSRAPSSDIHYSPPSASQGEAPTYTEEKYPRGTKVDPSDPDLVVSELPKPRIGSSHFWGVVETYGAKVGQWGLGPKLYAEQERKRKQEEETSRAQKQGGS